MDEETTVIPCGCPDVHCKFKVSIRKEIAMKIIEQNLIIIIKGRHSSLGESYILVSLTDQYAIYSDFLGKEKVYRPVNRPVTLMVLAN